MDSDRFGDELLDEKRTPPAALWRLRLLGIALFGGVFILAVGSQSSLAVFFEPYGLILVVAGTAALGLVSFTPEQWRTSWRCLVQPNGRRSCGERRLAAGVFRICAAYAIGVGALATLMGIVMMLANLDDPTKIGPAAAIALLSSIYGTLLAILLVVAGTVASSSSDWTATIASRTLRPVGTAAAAAAGAVGVAVLCFMLILLAMRAAT